MDFTNIYQLALAIIVLALKPGPGMVLLVFRSIKDGFKGGYMVSLGYITVEIIFFLIVIFAFKQFQAYQDLITIILKSFGATYLIYLGIKGFQKSSLENEFAQTDKTHSNLWENYSAGIVMDLGNPIVILLYAAILPTFLDMQNFKATDIITGLIVMALANNFVHIFLALSGQSIKKLLNKPKTFRTINACANTAYIILGLIIGWSAMPVIDWQALYY
ncbi:MAG: hypothetical protein CMH30_09250 [Micavibrio sp.]|nr:hypothetical protein [Micavibrio sp.]|tara:strand:+ start:4646 stop:5299 length:654 start_codon:yes stop_codon:yes gene_type:complete